MSTSDTVITATLIRGKTYQYSQLAKVGEEQETFKFLRAVPQEVTEDIAEALEDLVDIVTSRDGRERIEIERQIFRINYEADTSELNVGKARERAKSRKRLRLVSADDADSIRAKKNKPSSSRIKKRR